VKWTANFLPTKKWIFAAFLSWFCLYHQAEAQEKAWQQGVPLKWEDFKGEVPAERLSSQASYLDYKLGMEYSGKMVGDSLVMDFTITPIMLQGSSWVDRGRANAQALAFEQLRFDLVALEAHKLQQILNATSFNPQSVRQQIDQLYQEHLEGLRQTLGAYSSASFFGSRAEVQQEWRQKVDSTLKEYFPQK